MKNVFIDSNIWLSLYHFTSDDLNQFSKLRELEGNDIQILIPTQTINEVKRNRDSKIKESISKFKEFKLSFPAFVKSYEEYDRFSQDYSDLISRHKAWCKKIDDDVINQQLHADKVINEFFKSCTVIESSSEIIRAAEIRYLSGNPPGKENKYGDAINWESLLHYVPEGEDLYFVSSDKDYKSVINDSLFNTFLLEEWGVKKKSMLYYFNSLTSFLKEHAKDIELQTEQEKDGLISGLQDSRNFQTTHAIIKSLDSFHGWSEQQVENMCAAAINNTQVLWILSDDDVFDFYSKLLAHSQLESDTIDQLKERLNDIEQSRIEDSDIPL